jgi:hypothetical protein
MNEPALRECLMNEPQGFYREPHRGFRFRGLDDPTIYFNDNDRGLMANYRNAFMRLAYYYANTVNDTAKIVETLDMMEKRIPRSIFPMDYRLLSDVARFYSFAGRTKTYNEMADELEKTCWGLIDAGQGNATDYYNPYRVLIEIYGEKKEYAKEKEVLQRVQVRFPNDPTLKTRIRQLDSLMAIRNFSSQPESAQSAAGKH